MSNKEPEDKNIIWLKDRKLYIWDGGWKTICNQDITVNPEDITVDLSEYLKKTEANSIYQVKGDYALKSDIPTVPTKLSELNNDTGYITADDIPEVELPDNIATTDYVDNAINSAIILSLNTDK